VEKIPVNKIIQAYRHTLEFDVSRFFHGLQEIGIYKCADTGFRFYYPESIFADEAFYAMLQEREYYSSWTWEHMTAFKELAPSSRVLEIGCGTGSFIQKLGERGFNCTGLELNYAAVIACRNKGLDVRHELIENHAREFPRQYDAVCSFQVVEHVYEVGSLLQASLDCLKPGGTLIFGVPNNNPYIYKYDKLHAMNLPPHHSGMWNKSAVKQLPSFFPITSVKSVRTEPLYNRIFFLQTWLRHIGLVKLSRTIENSDPKLLNKVLWPLKLFFQGRNLVAVIRK
jgi:SAM-dependent methyltransferase